MVRKAKDRRRSVAQLRVMLRRWRERAWWGVCLAVLSLLGVVASWWFAAHGFWWLLSILGVLSAAIEVCSDINAIHTTQKRIVEQECDPDALAN